MNHFIFDVDGTLTPSRGIIDPSFLNFMLEFATENLVYLCTGSDAPKTIEQIGTELFDTVTRSYNCSGNSVWEKGVNVYNNDWTLPEKPWKYLESRLLQSTFSPKTGWHFDERPGLLNFSIVGRKATPKQRELYVDWDSKTNERRCIADEFNQHFSKEFRIIAHVAGETGLDIAPIGKGKEQIIKDFDLSMDTIHFFGDRTDPGGNDYDIARVLHVLANGHVHAVNNWQETYEILKTFK